MKNVKILAENSDKTKFIVTVIEERIIGGEIWFKGIIIGYMYKTDFKNSHGVKGKKKGYHVINCPLNLYRKSDYTFYAEETYKKFNINISF